jgi:hypothetical protein
MPVHHVHVKQIGARPFHSSGFFAKAGEIAREDGGGNFYFQKAHLFKFQALYFILTHREKKVNLFSKVFTACPGQITLFRRGIHCYQGEVTPAGGARRWQALRLPGESRHTTPRSEPARFR